MNNIKERTNGLFDSVKDKGYFVAEISNFKGNPIHTCILYYAGETSIFNLRMQASYEDECISFRSLSEFYYLKLIRKIDMEL